MSFSSSVSDSSSALASLSSLSRCSLEHRQGGFGGFVQEARNFLVDHLRRVLAVAPRFGHLLAQKRMIFAVAEGHRAEPLAHAPVGDHSPGDLRGRVQVVLRAGDSSLKTSFSADRPPRQTISRVRSSLSPMLKRSSSGRSCVTPSERPRGMIETLCTRSALGSSQANSAWPAS